MSYHKKNRVRHCAVTVSTVLLSAVLLLHASGCTDSRDDARGTRVAATGFVTIDGKALDAGRILFITNQGAGTVKASAAIRSGTYLFTAENGPLHGQARVEIFSAVPEQEEFEAVIRDNRRGRIQISKTPVPQQYNVRTVLKAQVSADADRNVFPFDLSSK